MALAQRSSAQSEVLVIGAGISGLAAARKLKQAGTDVVILEGRARKGGRLFTADVAGTPVDLGGQWIHGVKGNPLTTLAQQFGLVTKPSNPDDGTLFDASGEEVEDDLNDKAESLMARFMKWLETQRTQRTVTTNTSLQQAYDTWLTTQSLDSSMRALLRQTLNSAIEQEYAASLKDLSAFYDWNESDKLGGSDAVWQQGYSGLINALAMGLEIVYNQQVVSIDYSGPQTVVTTATGDAFTASYVISTIPVGVLQSATAPTFNPPLPARKQTAISSLGMGLLNKVILKFPTAFWNKTAPTNWINMLPVSEPGTWTEFFALSKPLGASVPVLVAFSAGDFAWAQEQLSNAEITAAVTQRLQTLFRRSYVPPTSVVITRWGKEPWSYGSYPYLKVGAATNAFEVMSEPVQSKLFFAGDATNPAYTSTAHGSFLSGEREAKRILALLERRR